MTIDSSDLSFLADAQVVGLFDLAKVEQEIRRQSPFQTEERNIIAKQNQSENFSETRRSQAEIALAALNRKKATTDFAKPQRTLIDFSSLEDELLASLIEKLQIEIETRFKDSSNSVNRNNIAKKRREKLMQELAEITTPAEFMDITEAIARQDRSLN